MDKRDYFKAFLEEIKASGTQGISLSAMAKKLGVNRSSVLRNLAQYKEQGILNENYLLTSGGKLWFQSVMQRMERLKNWFTAHNMEEERAYADALRIIKNCSDQGAMLLSNIGILCSACDCQPAKEADWFSALGEEFEQKYPQVLFSGRSVFFNFWKENAERNIRELSMANAGFVQPGALEASPEGLYVVLNIVNMTQQSLMGRWFEAVAAEVEYESPWSSGGDWERALLEGSQVRLPVSVFRISYKEDFSCIRGRLRVRIACSAGAMAMPANTVILEIRMYGAGEKEKQERKGLEE